jgi:carbonic anhydrase
VPTRRCRPSRRRGLDGGSVNCDAGSSITVDGIRFDLKQFQVHSPGEDRIHGKCFPLETHLVQADKEGTRRCSR